MTLATVGAGTSITTGTATQKSIPISGKSSALRVVATGQNTFVAIGTEPAATATDFILPANSSAVLSINSASARIVSYTKGSTTILDFPEGTSSPFVAGQFVSLSCSTQTDFDFTHKRVKTVFNQARTSQSFAGENFFGQRIIVEHNSSGVSGTFNDPDATLRSSFKVAAMTDTGSGKLHIQQVQIAGQA
tara:strand:+ start:420 stop:989 length:570 start_codon:yes stop_codon:yes gene_type:complete